MREIFILIMVSCVLTVTFAQKESLNFSLDECISYALENNEQIEIAKLANEITVTQINEILAQGLPQLNGNIRIAKNFDIQTSFIQDFISPAVYDVLIDERLLPDGTPTPAIQTFPAAFGTAYSGITELNVSQLIFDGAYFIGLKASKTGTDLSQKQQNQVEVEVVENISKSYYLALIAKENLEFIGRNFAQLDTLYRETQIRYETGFAEKIDVSRLKIQHNNLRTNLKNNAELLVSSINLLKFQMGMPMEQKLKLTGELTEAILSDVEIPKPDSYKNRPEFEIFQISKKLLQLNIKNFQSQYLPKMYANFNLGWTAGTNSFDGLTNFDNTTWFRYSNLGVSLSLPIFDGFSKRANIQRNEIQIKQIQQRFNQFKNNFSREVTEANINMENAKRKVESQNENVLLAEEVYNVTRIKYQEGVGSNLEVIEANTSLKEAQTNYLNALYEAITSQIELKKALGILYNN